MTCVKSHQVIDTQDIKTVRMIEKLIDFSITAQ